MKLWNMWSKCLSTSVFAMQFYFPSVSWNSSIFCFEMTKCCTFKRDCFIDCRTIRQPTELSFFKYLVFINNALFEWYAGYHISVFYEITLHIARHTLSIWDYLCFIPSFFSMCSTFLLYTLSSLHPHGIAHILHWLGPLKLSINFITKGS